MTKTVGKSFNNSLAVAGVLSAVPHDWNQSQDDYDHPRTEHYRTFHRSTKWHLSTPYTDCTDPYYTERCRCITFQYLSTLNCYLGAFNGAWKSIALGNGVGHCATLSIFTMSMVTSALEFYSSFPGDWVVILVAII